MKKHEWIDTAEPMFPGMRVCKNYGRANVQSNLAKPCKGDMPVQT